MVGSAPLGLSVQLDNAPSSAEDVLKLASTLRLQFMRNSRKVNYPSVVILNIVPFPPPDESPVAIAAGA